MAQRNLPRINGVPLPLFLSRKPRWLATYNYLKIIRTRGFRRIEIFKVKNEEAQK